MPIFENAPHAAPDLDSRAGIRPDAMLLFARVSRRMADNYLDGCHAHRANGLHFLARSAEGMLKTVIALDGSPVPSSSDLRALLAAVPATSRMLPRLRGLVEAFEPIRDGIDPDDPSVAKARRLASETCELGSALVAMAHAVDGTRH